MDSILPRPRGHRKGGRRGGKGEKKTKENAVLSTTTKAFIPIEDFTSSHFLSSSALPPANEVAGFLVGGIMLCVVLRASTLDAVIASAQAKSVARDDADGGKNGFGRVDEKDESVKRVKRGKGNVFILPSSEMEEEK